MGGNGLSQIQSLDELTKAGFTDAQARAVLRSISQDLASRADLEHATAELKRDIEGVRSELKRDIKELDAKIEGVRSELKKDIEATKAELKRDIAELKKDMVIIMGGYALFILFALVTLSKFGLMSPMP